MSIKAQSRYDDIEPAAGVAYGVESLGAAWRHLPLPVKVLVWAGVLTVAAPALRRAADSLNMEPSELLRIVERV